MSAISNTLKYMKREIATGLCNTVVKVGFVTRYMEHGGSVCRVQIINRNLCPAGHRLQRTHAI